jgi:hypothetical protein
MNFNYRKLETDIIHYPESLDKKLIQESLYSRLSEVEYNSTRILEEFNVDPDIPSAERKFYKSMCDEYSIINKLIRLLAVYDK